MAIRKADVVERVYEQLKRRAVAFDFSPGQKLKEGALAAEFGVSRTPVREALNRLVTEGFMTFVPNRGFFCRAVDLDGIAQIYEVRAALEVWAFQRSCAATPDARLQAFCTQWGAADIATGFATLDIYDCRFHSGMAALAGNGLLQRELQEIDEKILAFRNLELQDQIRRDKTLSEHHRIVDALAARNAVEGTEALAQHILGSAKHAIAAARQIFGEGPGPG